MGTLIARPLFSIGIKHWLPCKNTKQVRQQMANSVFAAVDTCLAQRRLVYVQSVCVEISLP